MKAIPPTINRLKRREPKIKGGKEGGSARTGIGMGAGIGAGVDINSRKKGGRDWIPEGFWFVRLAGWCSDVICL
jgi:hypothetical protein